MRYDRLACYLELERCREQWRLASAQAFPPLGLVRKLPAVRDHRVRESLDAGVDLLMEAWEAHDHALREWHRLTTRRDAEGDQYG